MGIQLTLLKCTLKNHLYYVIFYHGLKKEQWDGKIEADSFVEQLVPVLGCPSLNFLLCEESKTLAQQFFKEKQMMASQSLLTPSTIKTLHQLILRFGSPFILSSSEVLANLDHLVFQKSGTAQSPRLTFYIIFFSRLSWYQYLGQFSQSWCPYFLWYLALSILY